MAHGVQASATTLDEARAVRLYDLRPVSAGTEKPPERAMQAVSREVKRNEDGEVTRFDADLGRIDDPCTSLSTAR